MVESNLRKMPLPFSRRFGVGVCLVLFAGLFNFLSPFRPVHHSPPQRKQDDEVTTVQVKEQERNVLVLRKVQCCGPAPPAGSADSDWR